MSTLLLVLIGLMAGGLLGVAVTSALVAMRALADIPLIPSLDDSIPSPNYWLSPGLPPDTVRGEPRGSQGEISHRLETGAGRTPGLEDQPENAAPLCEGSRSGRRVEAAATRPTPDLPPRRDRRDPSAGWARLSHHSPHSAGWASRLSGLGGNPTTPPREEGEEQWTWG